MSAAEWSEPTREARVRNGWLVLLFSLLIIGIYTIGWLFRLQQEHPRRPGIDPPPGLWLLLFVAFAFGILALFAFSGYGAWDSWGQATGRQRLWFAGGLAAAVLFNAWFGYGSYRLTQRFRQLAHSESLLRRVQPTLIVLGVALEAVAVIVPATLEVGILSVPGTVERALLIAGRLGGGGLLLWAMVLHRDANAIARGRQTG